MLEEKKIISTPHNLILENRNKMAITGISDVDSFDEQTIVVYTDFGELTIKGDNLHITKLSVETGELNIDGDVSSLNYANSAPKSTGFFNKVFR